jgi:hypothetical protein|tara:strand:+ start:741 stop:965 length:225 start_codon:yes stop_codon:yes gene_type:complete
MTQATDSPKTLRMTAMTVPQASQILSMAFNRRIDEEHIQQVVDDGQLLRADGTFSLIEYVAFLARPEMEEMNDE